MVALDARRGPRLAREARDDRLVLHGREKELDRDRLFELLVERLDHNPHAARPMIRSTRYLPSSTSPGATGEFMDSPAGEPRRARRRSTDPRLRQDEGRRRDGHRSVAAAEVAAGPSARTAASGAAASSHAALAARAPPVERVRRRRVARGVARAVRDADTLPARSPDRTAAARASRPARTSGASAPRLETAVGDLHGGAPREDGDAAAAAAARGASAPSRTAASGLPGRGAHGPVLGRAGAPARERATLLALADATVDACLTRQADLAGRAIAGVVARFADRPAVGCRSVRAGASVGAVVAGTRAHPRAARRRARVAVQAVGPGGEDDHDVVEHEVRRRSRAQSRRTRTHREQARSGRCSRSSRPAGWPSRRANRRRRSR